MKDQSSWRAPPSEQAARYESECVQRAKDEIGILLQHKLFSSAKRAARLLEQESAQLAVANSSVAESFSAQSSSLFQDPSMVGATYLWINKQHASGQWIPSDNEQRKQINITLQDAIAWGAIGFLDLSSGDLGAALVAAHGDQMIADQMVFSKLINACQKNMRHLQNTGQVLVQYAIPSGNLQDAARRGRRRQRKVKTSDTESAEPIPQTAEHEAPAKSENHVADECPTAQDHLAESDQDEFHMDSVSIHGDASAKLPDDVLADGPCEVPSGVPTAVHEGFCSQSMVTASSFLYAGCPSAKPSLATLAQPVTGSLEGVLEEAVIQLASLLQQEGSMSAADKNQTMRMLYEQVPTWRSKLEQVADIAIVDWVRSGTGWQQRHQRVLVTLCIKGVDWELPVNTADVDLVSAVFSALQKYISIYGLTKVDSDKVLGSVLGISQPSWNASCYSAYIKLLGELLQGGAQNSDDMLLGAAVKKILEIAGWFHRNYFHTEATAALLEEAFSALSRIFSGSATLQPFQDDICHLARWCIYNYSHMNNALDAAKGLLHMGGRPH